MIIDAQNTLSSSQAMSGTGTVVSTNTIDLSVARDAGAGKAMHVVFNIDVALAGGTSIDYQIITSANAALTSPTVIGATGAQAATAASTQFVIDLPRVTGNGQRYLGVQFVRTGTYSAGSVTATLAEAVMDKNHYYASGFSVA
jgi:hypothetical protein